MRRTAFLSTTRRTTTQTPMPTRSMYCGSSEIEEGSFEPEVPSECEFRRVREGDRTRDVGTARLSAAGKKDEPSASRAVGENEAGALLTAASEAEARGAD